MRDIPIIYSGPMVQGLLREARKSGTGKTMTRRLAGRYRKVTCRETGAVGYAGEQTEWVRVKPGDRLWVRESMCELDHDHRPPRYAYMADTAPGSDGDELRKQYGYKWKPSIHMPRSASRLTLIVTRTKIERLQSITDADAKAEGIVEDDGDTPDIWYVPGSGGSDLGRKMKPLMADRPSKVFASLWCALHGRMSWDANPEVVALTFTVHLQNIDAMPKAVAA